jgi:hypothetical protein
MKPIARLLFASANVLPVWGYDAGSTDRATGPPDALWPFGTASPPLKGIGIMKRLTVVLLLTLAAYVAATSSAQAAPPTHERVPVDETFIDESCGFRVQGQASGVMLVIEWVDEDGTTRRFEGFPQARLTLTNLSTGKSITVNTAGSFHLTENSDGSLTAAGTGNWGFPFDLETGEPGFFLLYSGRWVFSIDAQGNESFRFVGRVRDLCAELAA